MWFDDLQVKHTQSLVAQSTDYGVWGDVLREQKADESMYRFGYQGQFSQRDLETGWNHFELREYDPVIGRWTATDPYGQYWSPYIGMGNDPVQGIDPDGGKCKTCPDGQQYDTYRNSNLDYAFSKLASGDGVYQMLPEMEVTYRYEAPPAMEMLAKFMTNYIMAMDGAFALEGIVSAGNYTAGMYSVARFEAVQAEKIAAEQAANTVIKYSNVLKSASSAYKGSTVLGHALSKHAGRNPGIWGRLTGNVSKWHHQALKHFDDIMNAPGGFNKSTTQQGINFLEKRLPDGRGIRLNMDGTFKGFID